ncbi:hypothetical protein Tco_0449489 [Tanacetum coccineum]
MENLYLKHRLVSRTYYKKSLIMASTFGSKSKSFMTMSIPSQDEPFTNRPIASFVTETPKNLGCPEYIQPLPHRARESSLMLDGSSSCFDATYSSEQNHYIIYQMKLEKALINFDSHQEKRLSSLRTQLGQQQDDMISKINLLWKAISKKLDDAPIYDIASNPTAQMNFTSTNDPMREELRGKGIESPLKLLSLKYLSRSSLAKKNRNPSSPKCFHFVNSIVILNKEDETKEEGNVKSITTKYKDYEMTVESEEESEEETEDEIEEEEEDSPKHFDTYPTMKELRLHYNWIMSKRMGPRRKPSNPGKIFNFVGRVKGLKFFVGNFTYECDFVVLEDNTSVIDHDP